MPELPEIEVLRISLHNLVTGSKIEKVKVNTELVCVAFVESLTILEYLEKNLTKYKNWID